MVKNYLYLNILFFFGLLLYLFSQNFNFDFKNTFYLFFGLFSILIPGLFLVSEFQYKDLKEKRAYYLLFYGFLLYGIGNLAWYLNQEVGLNFAVEDLNVLFLFQVFSKNYFFRYLTLSNFDQKGSKQFLKIFNLYLLILLFLIFFRNLGIFSENIDDYLFLFESLVSISYLLFLKSKLLTIHLDINYYLVGTLAWFFGDLIFLFEVQNQSYLMGDISDFIYFVGFYFMLSAVMFKNFCFKEKLKFNSNLSFS